MTETEDNQVPVPEGVPAPTRHHFVERKISAPLWKAIKFHSKGVPKIRHAPKIKAPKRKRIRKHESLH